VNSFVGNDLIDFAAAHNRGRARQARFLERVLTAAEREWLALADDGDRGFALLWSAKEAAYKAAKKHDPALVFAPRRWPVEWDAAAARPPPREASVVVAVDARIAVRWEEGNGWLHCIAFLGAARTIDEAVGTIDEWRAMGEPPARARDGIVRAESVAARNLAGHLLLRHGFAGIEILRSPCGPRPGPPQVVVGTDRLAGVDVSLAHDGRFVATVVAIDDAHRG